MRGLQKQAILLAYKDMEKVLLFKNDPRLKHESRPLKPSEITSLVAWKTLEKVN